MYQEKAIQMIVLRLSTTRCHGEGHRLPRPQARQKRGHDLHERWSFSNAVKTSSVTGIRDRIVQRE